MPFLSPALFKIEDWCGTLSWHTTFLSPRFLSQEIPEAARMQNVSHVNCLLEEGDRGRVAADGAHQEPAWTEATYQPGFQKGATHKSIPILVTSSCAKVNHLLLSQSKLYDPLTLGVHNLVVIKNPHRWVCYYYSLLFLIYFCWSSWSWPRDCIHWGSL